MGQVKCIDDRGSSGYLKAGEVYNIDYQIGNIIYLIENDHAWYNDRFVDLPEKQPIINEVIVEINRATSLHGKFNSPHEGYAVLLEEVDELWDEIKANNKEKARAEAIQVAAMAIRYIMDCT